MASVIDNCKVSRTRSGFALVDHAQEVAAIGRRCHRDGPRNGGDVLTAIDCGNHIRQHRHVDAALGNLAPDGVWKIGGKTSLSIQAVIFTL